MRDRRTEKRILVVEDELTVAHVLCDLVAELGHQARLAATAEAGLAALTSEPFDIVLLDLYLPRMSGADFLRARVVRDRGVPVIALSGIATENQVRATLQLGAVDVLPKPVPIDLLREILDYTETRTTSPGGTDRRRSPRPPLAVPVQVLEYDQPEWPATSLDLSVFGIKIRGQAPREPGQLVKLRFRPPDDGPLLELFALPVWRAAETYALRFANLSARNYERLRDLVRRLAE